MWLHCQRDVTNGFLFSRLIVDQLIDYDFVARRMPLAWLWFELDIQVMRLYVTWNWHLYTCNRCKLNAIYFHALSLSLCVCPSLSLSMSAAFDEINKVDAQPCHRFQWSVFKKRSPATGNGNRATCWKRAVRWVEMSIWKVVSQTDLSTNSNRSSLPPAPLQRYYHCSLRVNSISFVFRKVLPGFITNDIRELHGLCMT